MNPRAARPDHKYFTDRKKKISTVDPAAAFENNVKFKKKKIFFFCFFRGARTRGCISPPRQHFGTGRQFLTNQRPEVLRKFFESKKITIGENVVRFNYFIFI